MSGGYEASQVCSDVANVPQLQDVTGHLVGIYLSRKTRAVMRKHLATPNESHHLRSSAPTHAASDFVTYVPYYSLDALIYCEIHKALRGRIAVLLMG